MKKEVNTPKKSSDIKVSDAECLKRGDKRKTDKSFKKENMKDMSCFLCKRPHLVHYCPKRKALRAMKNNTSSKRRSKKDSSFEIEEKSQLWTVSKKIPRWKSH